MTSYSGGGEVRFAWSSNTWPGRRRRTVYAIHRLVQNACCSNFWFNTLVQLSTGRSWSFNWPVELSALYSQTFTWLSRRLSWTFKRNWSENIQLTLSIRLLLLLARISNRPASETFKIDQFIEIWSTKCDYVYTTPLYTPYTPGIHLIHLIYSFLKSSVPRPRLWGCSSYPEAVAPPTLITQLCSAFACNKFHLPYQGRCLFFIRTHVGLRNDNSTRRSCFLFSEGESSEM